MEMTRKERESEICSLLRPNIRNMVPYSTARDDCKAKMDIYLDANENPYDTGVNRYPSPHQPELKFMLSVLKKVPAENIFLGNGSDEPIDLVFRLFCPPGKSSMVQAVPTYGCQRSNLIQKSFFCVLRTILPEISSTGTLSSGYWTASAALSSWMRPT